MKRILALVLCLLMSAAALAEEVYMAPVTPLTKESHRAATRQPGDVQIITITCTGDTTLGSSKRVQTKYAKHSIQAYVEKNGYGYPFDGIRHLTETDDITLVNLEGVLYEPKELSTSRLVFNGPKDFAKILTEGSVEIVNLANNHTDDYGKQGYQSTIEALNAEGIAYSGDTKFGRELFWFDFENDVRIGFIGLLPAYRGENPEKVEQDFKKLKQAGCDVIIASIHAGVEGQATLSQMTDTYRKLAMNLGAHIVVGTHPHVPQGLWVEKGVTTLHSLGNFSFGGNTGVDEELYSPESIIAQIDLHFEGGEYIGHQVTIWPIMTTGTNPGSGMGKKGYANDYRPILVDGEKAQEIMKKVQKDTTFKLNPYVDGQGAVQEFVPWTGGKK